MLLKHYIASFSLFFSVSAVAGQSNIIYVSNTIGLSRNNGRSFNAPTNNLNTALQNVAAGGTILLCQGDVFSGQFQVTKPNITMSSYTCNPQKAFIKPLITSSIQVKTNPIVSTLSNGRKLWMFDISNSVQQFKDKNVLKMWAVWINGKRYHQARFPNVLDPLVLYGQNVDEFIFTSSFTSSSITPKKTPKRMSSTYWVNSTLRVCDNHWSNKRFRVKNILNGGTFELVTKDWNFLSAGSLVSGFYLEHGFEELDAPGEFHFNSATGQLYVIPISENEDFGDVWILPERINEESLINSDSDISPTLTILGTANNFRASNLSLARGFTGIMVLGQWRQILGSWKYFGNRVELRKLSFHDFLNRGVSFPAGGYIENSDFKNIDVGGIRGGRSAFVDGSSFTVSNSTFENIGLIMGYANQPFAISCQYRCEIKTNTFTSMGYGAINPESHSVVEGNIIDTIMLGFSDGAGIYAWSRENVTVQENVIRGIYPNKILSITYTMASGIYADDCSSTWNINNNYVEPKNSLPLVDGIYIHNSFKHTVANNTIVGSKLQITHDRVAFQNIGRYCEPVESKFLGNLFKSTAETKLFDAMFKVSYWVSSPDEKRTNLVIKENLFCFNTTNTAQWKPIQGWNFPVANNYYITSGECKIR